LKIRPTTACTPTWGIQQVNLDLRRPEVGPDPKADPSHPQAGEAER